MKKIRSATLFYLGLALTTLLFTSDVTPAPFTPRADDVVLEHLPHRPGDSVLSELRAARQALASRPNDPLLAGHLTRLYIKRARLDADPRYLGYAQAALAPWWDLAQPPVGILVMRAIILQANHRFDAALADLRQALRREPGNAQAWLTRASIEQAQGDYQAARKSCLSLAPYTNRLVAYTCLTSVTSLNGEAAKSYALLLRTLQDAPEITPDIRQWIEGQLAEMAVRRGDAVAAERHFQAALATGIPDSYLLASYADFLLDRGRAAEVVGLLREQTRADPLLLRLALAERTLKLPAAPGHIAVLRDRYAASRLRGDTLHRREEARFNLALLDNPDAALQLALENWQVQREPADARILLEAALATHRTASAQPALGWLAETRLEDVYLTRLTQAMARGAP